MTQTAPSETKGRSARPELFGARHGTAADFQESILAVIGGAGPKSRIRPRKATVWGVATGVVLAVAAVWVATLALRPAPQSPVPAALVAAAPAAPRAPAVPVVIQPAVPPAAVPEPVAAPAALPAEVAEPAASPAVEASSFATTARTSLPIGLPAAASPPVLDPTASPANLPVERRSPKVRERPVAAVTAKPSGRVAAAPAPNRPARRDRDAELLAAMLPYLNAPPGRTSPALTRRCGEQVSAACRVKFCNGREGVDAACPAEPDRAAARR